MTTRHLIIALLALSACSAGSRSVVDESGMTHYQVALHPEVFEGSQMKSVVVPVQLHGETHRRVLLRLVDVDMPEAERQELGAKGLHVEKLEDGNVLMVLRRDGELPFFRECHGIVLDADGVSLSPTAQHEDSFQDGGMITERITFQLGYEYLRELADANDSTIQVCRVLFEFSNQAKGTFDKFHDTPFGAASRCATPGGCAD